MINISDKEARVYVSKETDWTTMRTKTMKFINDHKDDIEIIGIQYLYIAEKWHGIVTYWSVNAK